MGKVVMYSSVSVDGFIADENDQPGPLFDWLTSGDVPLDDGGHVKVSQASHDYTRADRGAVGGGGAGPPAHARAVRGRERVAGGRPPRLRPHGRLGRHAAERDRPRGRRVAPSGA